jgi:hypothetical protein
MMEQTIIDRVSEPLLREFHLAVQALRDTIAATPEKEWIRGKTKGDVPVRHACHILHTFDSYTNGYHIKSGHRFGVPVDRFSRVVADADYPSREEVLVYADEMEAQLASWVPEMVRRALTGAPKARSPLYRVVYLLRHTVVHLSYVRRELYYRGIKRPHYRKRTPDERKSEQE